MTHVSVAKPQRRDDPSLIGWLVMCRHTDILDAGSHSDYKGSIQESVRQHA